MPRTINPNDLAGAIYGRLTIIRVSGSNKHGAKKVLCMCSCGKEKEVMLNSLRIGTTKSCGCLRKELLVKNSTKHSLCKHRLYHIFNNMKDRCYNENEKSYKNYGGRGIVICDEWLSDFQKFFDWSIANGYSSGLQIDRVNNNLGYCPDNCRYTTGSINSQNTRLIRKSNKTGYRGVCFSKNTYIAQLQTREIRIYKEGFKTAEEAAAYRDKCVVEHGICSPLNFPINEVDA